jgi:hypothetical protein
MAHGALVGETKWNAGRRMNLSNACRIFADLQATLPAHLRKGRRLLELSVFPSDS